ncbi:Ca2+-binding protein, RTX toxin-related [Pseudomonas indica]|uniref:Ca2+-binding protein, RTX toxin-related n=2 Tax=Pseudomonas indica TaxID=137658 RepID=A0A1G9H5S8_9PSED|nr:Ca2+-binding protein, RTX toxin-related [Pseudomonas indica]
MLFARFFPENTGEVVTLNAPGFFTNSSLLTTLGFPPPENNKITRLEADGDGISELGAPGFWPGTKIAIAQENEPGAVAAISTNHSSVNGNDALALMRVIALLDSRLDRDIATLSDLIRAASTEPGSSYEELLDGFRTLVLGKGLAATRRTTGTDPVEREPYYKHLQELETAISDGQLLNAVTIESLTNLTAEDLIGQAHSSLAYRYALVEANPFVVLGRESLYERHNQQGELELYDPVTGTGKLTAEWLTARADLLSRQIQAALVDRALAQDSLIRFGTDDSEELTVGYSNEGRGGSLFGGDGDDLLSGLSGRDYLEGGDGQDHLQGRAGADTLRGMAGEDVLTGGEGNDYLEGGLGADSYGFVKGDGFDRIVDVHGLNQIVIDGLPLTAVRQLAPGSNTYLSEDERIRLVLTDADKGTRNLLIEYGQNDRILIEDYRAEAFGLKLEDYQEPEAAAEPELNPLLGDLKPVDFDESAEGEQVDYDQWGNVRVTDTRDADREDRLFDTDGNDHLQGLGGNDSLRGTHGGHDRLDGGAGDDVLHDDKGDDTLIGGTGSDRLLAGEGNDRLFAGQSQSLSEALQAEPEKGLATRGDWLDGGRDDDLLIGSDGVDMLLGAEGKDTLYGGEGDDHLHGDGVTGWVNRDWSAVLGVKQQGGTTIYTTEETGADLGSNATEGDDDVLIGGGGNDHLRGNGGNDLLDGGQDNDVVFGDAGNDTLRGGAGNDFLSGDNLDTEGPDSSLIAALHGRDVLDGGEGDDDLAGNSGDDVLFGGAGDDELKGDDSSLKGRFGNAYQFHGNDYLSGGTGNDSLWGGGGNDTLLGGEDNDWLGGDYADLPTEYQGADLLDGGSGNDTLVGAGGDDTLIGGEGSDQLSGDAEDIDPAAHGDDLLQGGNGNDSLWGQGGADTLLGGDGNDFLRGDSSDLPDWAQGSDSLEGGLGSDTLLGDGGNDTLRGGDGIDYLSGDAGDNLLDGGAGDDVLQADIGNDHYLFNRGYGFDSIRDKGGRNVVEFGAGIGLDTLSVSVGRLNGDERMVLSANGDTVLLHDYQKWAGSTFRFADGRVLSFAQMMKRVSSPITAAGSASADTLYGTDNGDTLRGGQGDDVLTGQGGTDVLAGGEGNDTYVFELGDGDDMLADDQGDNVVRFGEGIDRSSLSFAERYTVSGTPVLEVKHSDGSVSILKGLTGAVSRFEFADGSSLSLAEAIRGFSGLDLQADDNGDRFFGSDAADVLTGGNGSDVIDGQGGDDQIRGGAGDDSLLGGAGNDALQGGAGDDHLHGGGGDDTLVGGLGNDTLDGGAGNNLFVFRQGSQSDRLAAEAGSVNTLQFDPTLDIGKLTSQRLGDDLILAYRDSDDAMRIEGYFAGTAQWSVQVGEGPVQGLEAFRQQLAAERAALDIAHYERLFKREVLNEFGDLMVEQGYVLRDDGLYAKKSINEYRKEVVETLSIREAHFSDVQVSPEDGKVSATGDSQSSARSVVKQVSTLSPSGMRSGLAPGKPDYRSFTPEMLEHNDDGSITVYVSRFAEGSIEYNLSGGGGGLVGFVIYPEDYLSSDWLGASREMEYIWRTETTRTDYKVAYGHDEGGLTYVDPGNIFHAGAGDDLIFGRNRREWFEKVKGVMLSGGAGNDTIRGSEDDDILVGGSGTDWLYGGEGVDTYLVTEEAGAEIIADFMQPKMTSFPFAYPVTMEYPNPQDQLHDEVVLPEGVSLDRLVLNWGTQLMDGIYLDELQTTRIYWVPPEYGHRARMLYATLDISWGTDQLVRVVMPRANDPQGSGIELFRFADGSTISLEDLLSRAGMSEVPDPYLRGGVLEDDGSYDRSSGSRLPLAGGKGNDTLKGSGELHGWDGDDALFGGEGNDSLNGGRGADTLVGGDGNDRLGYTLEEYFSQGNTYEGGQGNDTIYGSQDADTYRFGKGDGQDIIVDLYHLNRDRYSSSLYMTLRYGGPEWAGMPADLRESLYRNEPVSWLQEADPHYVGRDTLAFGEGIAPGDVTARLHGADLVFELAGGEDSVRFENWVLQKAKPLKEVVFADGTVWGEDWLDQLYPYGTAGDDLLYLDERDDSLSGLRGNDTLYGYGGNDWLAGGPGDDRLYGGVGDDELHGATGNDELDGGAGNDTLVGGAGADTMEGGKGDDLYHADALDTLIEYADGGTDTVMTSESWTLGEHFEDLVLVGNKAVQGIGNDLDNRIRGNDADNYLTGGEGADLLWGRGGNDVLEGGAGDDTLVGGVGDDTYRFGRGDGRDTVVENDATPDNVDFVRFLSDINPEQLWFRQTGQDLEIQLSGTTDSLLIRDWYKGSAHHVERFDSADGRTLLDSQVQNLVDAMAAFGAPAGGLSSLPDMQRMQLETVIAANWH